MLENTKRMRKDLMKMETELLRAIAQKEGVKVDGRWKRRKPFVDAILGSETSPELVVESVTPPSLHHDIPAGEPVPSVYPSTPPEDEILTAAPLVDDNAYIPPPPAPVAVQSFPPKPIITKAAYPTMEEITLAVDSHVKRGMVVVQLTADYWHFRMKNREAAGNTKIPLNNIVQEANSIMQRTSIPTNGMDIEEILALKIPRG